MRVAGRWLTGRLLTISVASVVLLVSCGPNLAARRLHTEVNGRAVDFGSVSGLSCSSIGIGTRPTQADIDLCKANLDPTAGAQLQIMWKYFDEVVTDGVHNLDTCPILALYPIQQGHADGSINDASFAKKIYDFYKAKLKQDLNGKAAQCKAAMTVAGLPLP